jgi:hypothetical protein
MRVQTVAKVNAQRVARSCEGGPWHPYRPKLEPALFNLDVVRCSDGDLQMAELWVAKNG